MTFTGRATLLALLAFLAGALVPAGAGAAEVRNYDLGVVKLSHEGPKGPEPVRLWGAIGVPDGRGPHPFVIVAHGRHGDNCPDTDPRPYDYEFVWPCWAREQRNDLGMRHIVAALARRGIAAIAPDLNGAYTLGWGPDRDRRRWPRIVNRTVGTLTRSVRQGGMRFGIRLKGRINLNRRGILAHSRSGLHAVRQARSSAPYDSIFLLAPVHEKLELPGNRPTAIVAAACDGDVPGEARTYFNQARRRPRSRPIFFIELEHANHNYFNRTLSDLGRDDARFAGASGGCGKRKRLRPGSQQGWIDHAAAAFFDATLDGGPRPAWMRRGRPEPEKLYGLSVMVDRLFP